MENETESKFKKNELFVGLVGAVGTDLGVVTACLEASFKKVNYKSKVIKLSELLHEIEKEPWNQLPKEPEDTRIQEHMNAGNKFREELRRGDALALLAIGAIREERESAKEEADIRSAYILRSLKHLDEVNFLRKTYGPNFILVAAYSPREKRIQNITRRIAESHHVFQSGQFRSAAESLIQRDEAEVNIKFGQNVREVFPMADVFINTDDEGELEKSINRFIELLFGHTFHTPTCDEYGMFHAQAAALRSAALGRQVGAVISTIDGDIIAVGTNEVPKAGGGLYWCEDDPDHRDFRMGYDTNDRMKKDVLIDILKRLKSANWFSGEQQNKEIEILVGEALNSSGPMRGAHFMNLIEFGRSVHGEMAALVDAARRGVPVRGCTLYCSTFPCHDCAKHIVAAGINRVVYIEPYPKSLVPELYLDSIAIDSKPDSTHVSFEPFVGVAPRVYMDLFLQNERKQKDGKILAWDPSVANPRLSEDPSFWVFRSAKEGAELMKFKEQMETGGLKVKRKGG